MEEESRKGRVARLGIAAALVLGICATATAIALRGEGTQSFAGGAAVDGPGTVLHCATGYSTNLDWNISHEEVLSFVPAESNYANFKIDDPSGISSIVTSITASNGQFYKAESGKTGYQSWKFGTGSKAGSLTITLDREVDAVGLYAVAYANSKDAGKYLTVNGIDTSAGLLAAESYDADSAGQRFLVELEEPSDEIVISAKNASNNRFYLYSVGFYFA